MSKVTTLKHLEEIKIILENTIKNVSEGHDEKETLKIFNMGLDKQLGKLVKDLGGESYYYKGNNLTSWQLAMGEVT